MTTGATGATVGAAAPATIWQGGLWSWITTVDHKRVGVLYGVSAFIFFLLGGIEAVVIRLQLAAPESSLISAQTYNALFTMHGTTMIFLAVMPIGAMFFNFLIPLMIGARDVAFPRLNAFSYWVFLAGGILLNVSWLFQAAPDIGWFGYANLTAKQYTPGISADFWLLGLQMLGIASLAAAFNFIVTIVNMRAPGMRLMRLPPFVWMSLITNVLLALAFPVITVALILLMIDRFFGTHFYVPTGGGDPVLWQHLFWVFGHPEVYILILPAMGIVSEILPTFARKPLFGYPFVIFSGIGIAVLGFGVWAHHMFAVGMGPLADAIFAITTMAIAIPTGVKIFNWLATLWGGSIALRTPLLYAVGFIAMFTMGGLSGVMHASPPADLQQTDTYFIVAHFHYVLFGGSMLALLGGVHYWFPKMTGRMLDERLSRLGFWLVLIGFNVTFLPMHWVGLLGMPRRTYTYQAELNLGGWNLLETVGALILVVAFLVFTWNLLKSLAQGERAPVNPWDAPTLEWSLSSPPPAYNFATIPTVQSRYPLWEERSATAQPAGDAHGIHLPNPSYWPALAGLGILIMGAGALAHASGLGYTALWIALAGVAVLAVSLYAWAFEPAS